MVQVINIIKKSMITRVACIAAVFALLACAYVLLWQISSYKNGFPESEIIGSYESESNQIYVAIGKDGKLVISDSEGGFMYCRYFKTGAPNVYKISTAAKSDINEFLKKYEKIFEKVRYDYVIVANRELYLVSSDGCSETCKRKDSEPFAIKVINGETEIVLLD